MATSPIADQSASASPLSSASKTSFYQWAALALSIVALAGSLTLSLAMDLWACPLCFYQRTFVMSLAAVLGIGLVIGIGRRLGLLALPLAAAGLGVALFHVFLEASGKLECPRGLLDLGTAPQQSLAMFLGIFALLLADGLQLPASAGGKWIGLSGGLVLGALLAVASSTSNPPMQKPSPEAYAKPPHVCRPPK